MFTVYVLRSTKDSKLYTGTTNDLERRISEHNRGDNFSTQSRGPFVLIYAEYFHDQEDARLREKFLKTGWGRAHLNRVLKNYLRKSKI